MEYFGIYTNEKKELLIDAVNTYDEGISLLIDCWFDGYDNCILTKITKEEYEKYCEEC